MCVNSSVQSGGLLCRGHELPQDRINRVQYEDDVLRSSADRAEMCHQQTLQQEDTHTHRRTDTYRKFVLSHMLYGISPPCLPLTRVFALFITSTLALRPFASSLPVSNSNQSVGRRGGVGGGRSGGHTKERPMGVSTTPDCGFSSLPLAKSLLGTFPAILIVYHQGNIMSRVCLID